MVLGHDIGDGEADLPMFRAASRSAPANIGPRREAKLLGCRSRRDEISRGLLRSCAAS
jgi:hypothetical protein